MLKSDLNIPVIKTALKRNASPLTNELLKTSFYYRDFQMAQTLILSGASFQAVLLQSEESEIKSIGTAIYQMHKYSTGKSKFGATVGSLLRAHFY